ncbi:MAG: thioredoxin family protein [Acetobacterium sp.]|nr:thioredoxin family protein [Acetobacterium sp.]
MDQTQSLAQQYRVMSVPTMKIFKDGEVVETIVGLQSKGVLMDKLNYYAG